MFALAGALGTPVHKITSANSNFGIPRGVRAWDDVSEFTRFATTLRTNFA